MADVNYLRFIGLIFYVAAVLISSHYFYVFIDGPSIGLARKILKTKGRGYFGGSNRETAG